MHTIMDRNVLIEKICESIRAETEYAVIGLSGGADSTLVATLCKRALGAERVFGISMPYNNIDKKKFNLNSEMIANKLGINRMVVSIQEPVNALIDNFTKQDFYTTRLVDGNIRSRMRMNILYAAANIHSYCTTGRVRVIGTGNLSEDFIGYDTKGGDALADFFPIGQLYKQEVYSLLDYFVEIGELDESMIDRTPSAGLWDGQTDEDELGYSYNDMQSAVQFCIDNYNIMDALILSEGEQITELIKFVWNRHIVNKHKHEAPKVAQLFSTRIY